MAVKTEGQRAGEFILFDEPYISREIVTVTVPANTTLKAGAVLGQQSVGGKYVQYDNNETDGSETAAGILYDNLENDTGAPVDKKAAIVESFAAVRRADLQYQAGQDGDDKTAAEADLASRFIKVRD